MRRPLMNPVRRDNAGSNDSKMISKDFRKEKKGHLKAQMRRLWFRKELKKEMQL